MEQELGVAEPGGGDVGGIHAPGDIAEDQQIPAFFFKGEQSGVKIGTPAGDDDKKYSGAKQETPQESAPAGKMDGAGGVSIGSQQSAEAPGSACIADKGKKGQQRHGDDQKVKPVRLNKIHLSSFNFNYSLDAGAPHLKNIV